MVSAYWQPALADYLSFFHTETSRVLEGWDKSACLKTCPNELDYMLVVEPLPCGDNFIHPVYRYNGASVGILRYIPFFHFPKWRHPIATAKHDYRIDLAERLLSLGLIDFAEYNRLRLIADQLFKADVAIGQKNEYRSQWEQTKGYVGVRIGANWRKVKQLWK